MKTKLSRIAILSFTVFLSFTTLIFTQNVDKDTSDSNFLEEVDSIVHYKMNQYDIPGLAIGIIRDDSIITSKGYGVRSIHTNSPVTENTIFHTASISKLFTAIAIIKLVEQNVLSLDDRLVDILPDLDYSDKFVNEITIESLLNHTSGLPDIDNYHWSNNNTSKNSLENYVLGLNLELESQPTLEYRYSNLAYDILGYIIEKVSGSTFEDFIKKNSLDESEMHNSDFRYFKIPDSLKTDPHSKRWLTGNIYVIKNYPYTREHAPSSTLNSSSWELSKWMITFLQNLDNSEYGNVYSALIETFSSTNPYIGLGFQLSSINSKKTIGHYGGDKGFRSYLVMIPEVKIGLVVLANCDYNEDFRQEILHPIAKRMLKKYKKY